MKLTVEQAVSNIAGEEERIAIKIRDLKELIGTLELELADPAPPGVGNAQGIAHAATDLATYVARLDLQRRMLLASKRHEKNQAKRNAT